ncbi:uncharacterized protein LOC135495745 [Lineus longissimus]|uniref:uncharacterized protein LOC135495745 n=1 Tax=Lineus longissimus TaxID=88925 RepID=UPI00315CDA07
MRTRFAIIWFARFSKMEENVIRMAQQAVAAALMPLLQQTGQRESETTATASASVPMAHRVPLPQSSTTHRVDNGLGLLPSSFMNRGRGSAAAKKRGTTAGKGKAKVVVKDVVCIPKHKFFPNMAVPKGSARGEYAEMGLSGKISFSSHCMKEEMEAQVKSIFCRQFNLSASETFAYEYLCILPGTRKLGRPNVSTNFVWNGKAVLSIIGQGALYIMANTPFPEALTSRRATNEGSFIETDEDDDDDFLAPAFTVRSRTRMTAAAQQSPVMPVLTAMPAVNVRPAVTATPEVNATPETTRNIPDFNFDTYNVTDFIPMEFLDDPEAAVDQAVQNSMINADDVSTIPDEEDPNETSAEVIEGKLRAHASTVVIGPTRPLVVSRSSVWASSLPYFRRKAFFNGMGDISMTFGHDEAIEDAQDLGGPKREYFRLLLKAIVNDSGMLDATPNGMTLSYSINAVKDGLYQILGKVLAMVVVLGGQAPAMFTPAIARYLAFGDISLVGASVDDVPISEIRMDLKKIVAAETASDFDAILAEADWRFGVKGLQTVVKFEKKNVFVDNVTLFYGILDNQSLLDEVIQGLKYYGVLGLIRNQPSLRCLFEYKKDAQITAVGLIQVFKPMLSVLGNHRRETEQSLMDRFKQFVFKIEDKELEDEDIFQVSESDTEVEKTEQAAIKAFASRVTCGHILAFATGASEVPPMGFEPRAHISFVHDDSKVLPSANTCANELKLFVNAMTIAPYRLSREFLKALMNGAVFSLV